ncbi:MAG: Cif family virulence factor [Planctomycetota bacterium]|jgi:ketosteroid isomerase-like protein
MRYAGGALAIIALAAAGGTAFAAPGRALERSVGAADLVVVTEGGRVARSSPRPVLWAFRVADMLKGDGGPSEVKVDLEKAPLGLWPRKGERAILCLSWGAGGTYELASHFRSILEPDEAQAVREVVAASKVAADTSPETDTGKPRETRTVTTPVGPRRDPAADLMKRRVAGADTILVGTLSGVRPSGSGAEGIFRVEESLLGYGGFTEPIGVRLKGSSPEAGRYVLFLRGSLTDATFSTSAREGTLRIADAAAGKRIKDSVRSSLRARKGKVLTTVQATLAEWQQAWNARDLKRCMRCYASGSKLRRQYDSGAEGRQKLEQQMANFPGKVSLTLRRIGLSPRPGTRAADATVMLKLTASGMEDRRTATMQLVHEDGEWLILNEGF